MQFFHVCTFPKLPTTLFVIVLIFAPGCHHDELPQSDPAASLPNDNELTEPDVAPRSLPEGSSKDDTPAANPEPRSTGTDGLVEPIPGSFEAIPQGGISGPNTTLPGQESSKDGPPNPAEFYKFGPS